ncbi:MAG: glycosyltransferase family 39 protein [Candidatus Omnitrophica bacterium]|nr:glycosyltransferase family 39 protein [Candidatus Omnitrophota bacterium]
MEKYLGKNGYPRKMLKGKRLGLVCLILLGVILRFWGLTRLSLWCDESEALFLGRLSIQEMLRFISRQDAHPPLFYLLIHGMLKVGETDGWLRVLPALAGSLCLPVAWSLARRLAGEKEAFYLIMFLAVSPVHILWSQVVKSYTLFTLLGLLSSLFFFQCLSEEEFRWRLALFWGNLLLLYLHHYSIFFLASQFLTLLWLKKFDRRWMIFYFLIFVFWIPWLIVIPYQLSYTGGIIRRLPQVLRLPYFLFYTVLGETVSPFNPTVVLPAAASAITGWFFGFVKLRCLLPRETRIFFLFLLLLPLAAIPFRSTLPQNLVPFTIFWYLLLALGLREKMKRPFLFMALVTMIFSDIYYFTGRASQFHDVSRLAPIKEIAEELSRRTRSDDIIVINEERKFAQGKPISIFDHYYRGNIPVLSFRPESGPLEQLDNILVGYNRVWLLQIHAGEPVWNKQLRQYFQDRFLCEESSQYLENERWLQTIRTGQREFYPYVTLDLFTRKIE